MIRVTVNLVLVWAKEARRSRLSGAGKKLRN